LFASQLSFFTLNFGDVNS